MFYYQTGDVLYIKESKIPKGAKALKTNLFHKGENHEHLVRGEFTIYEHGDDLYLKCKSDCELYHDEHHTILAKPGIYKKRIVKEYDHLLEEARNVID
jgi:hypothetical protein